MQLGMIGLGKMGGNMARRLTQGGHQVVVYDRDAAAIQALAAEGMTGAGDLADMVAKLQAPRAIWLSLPSGPISEGVIEQLETLLAPGDVIVDAANEDWRVTKVRAERLAAKGLHLVDQGTSGGVWGLANGFCLMIGADLAVFERLEAAFASLAPPEGYLRAGPPGAGHYVKMVHNGVEYGLMQAYAEGFELLHAAPFEGMDLHAIAHNWNQGGVVRSWLLQLAEDALAKDPGLEQITGWVDDSGMGRWTVEAGIDQAVPTPVLALALMMRFRSRQADTFAGKLLSALRNEFGGHAVHKA